MSDKYFKKALVDFTLDFASGDAIRNLADKGYSVSKIHDKLDFPTPVEKIKATVWKHFVDTGVILLEEPSKESPRKQVSYEKVQDSFGRVSFKQVVVDNQNEPKEYIACDFGKRIYKDKEEFTNSLQSLDNDDRQYILDLPWPISTVWVMKTSKIADIKSRIQ